MNVNITRRGYDRDTIECESISVEEGVLILAGKDGAEVGVYAPGAWESATNAEGSEAGSATLAVQDSPKMIRETLCVAQAFIGTMRAAEHIERLGRLIDECDRHRPLGRDGKHGNLHTPTCGCDR